MFSKEREIFKIFCNKRLDEIDELCKTIDYGDLKFIISSSGTETYLSGLKYQFQKHDISKKNLIDI